MILLDLIKRNLNYLINIRTSFTANVMLLCSFYSLFPSVRVNKALSMELYRGYYDSPIIFRRIHKYWQLA